MVTMDGNSYKNGPSQTQLKWFLPVLEPVFPFALDPRIIPPLVTNNLNFPGGKIEWENWFQNWKKLFQLHPGGSFFI